MKVGTSNLEGIKRKNRKTVLRGEEEKEEKQERKQESERKVEKKEASREIMVKIGLERINIQERITVEALLNSSVMGLVISSEFARKQRFRLKKIKRPIYVRNVNGLFNKEGLIKHMVEVNIYYQEHREKTKIDVIGGQK